jgi:predicted PurR-regulated permease PerM
VGAILAAIPATLVALTQGPLCALWVLLMYCGVHFVEGNFITPLVQAEATALPPVMSLVSIVAFSTIFGPSAVMLAVPLGLTLAVVVRCLSAEPVEPSATSRSGDPDAVESISERREPLLRGARP